MKIRRLRCRDGRDKPRGGGGIHPKAKVWPEKLAEPSSEVHRNASCVRWTSARDGGSYEWRLAMAFLDLRSVRRGEHRHI
jgi:hypothetical protein